MGHIVHMKFHMFKSIGFKALFYDRNNGGARFKKIYIYKNKNLLAEMLYHELIIKYMGSTLFTVMVLFTACTHSTNKG